MIFRYEIHASYKRLKWMRYVLTFINIAFNIVATMFLFSEIRVTSKDQRSVNFVGNAPVNVSFWSIIHSLLSPCEYAHGKCTLDENNEQIDFKMTVTKQVDHTRGRPPISWLSNLLSRMRKWCCWSNYSWCGKRACDAPGRCARSCGCI